MALKTQSTKVTERPGGFVVEMILSSASDLETASDVVQLRATVDISERAPRLARLQEAALCRARDAMQDEIECFRSIVLQRQSP